MKNIMKLAVLPVLFTLGAGFAQAAGNDCDAKRSAIEAQIREAKAHGNYHQVAGLQAALNKVNTYCNNDSLVAKAQQKVEKAEKKVAEKKDDVREVQADLKKAQLKGDAKKVAKLVKKVSEKQADVAKAEADLKQVRAELAALKS